MPYKTIQLSDDISVIHFNDRYVQICSTRGNPKEIVLTSSEVDALMKTFKNERRPKMKKRSKQNDN